MADASMHLGVWSCSRHKTHLLNYNKHFSSLVEVELMFKRIFFPVVRSPERKSSKWYRVSFENAFKGLLRRIIISNGAKMEKAKITVLLYGHWNLLREKISSTLKKKKNCQSPAKI